MTSHKEREGVRHSKQGLKLNDMGVDLHAAIIIMNIFSQFVIFYHGSSAVKKISEFKR